MLDNTWKIDNELMEVFSYFVTDKSNNILASFIHLTSAQDYCRHSDIAKEVRYKDGLTKYTNPDFKG